MLRKQLPRKLLARWRNAWHCSAILSVYDCAAPGVAHYSDFIWMRDLRMSVLYHWHPNIYESYLQERRFLECRLAQNSRIFGELSPRHSIWAFTRWLGRIELNGGSPWITLATHFDQLPNQEDWSAYRNVPRAAQQ